MRLLVGEVATVVLDGQRAVPEQLQALGFSFDFPDVEVALLEYIAAARHVAGALDSNGYPK